MASSEHGSTTSGGVEQKTFAWEDGDFIEAGEPSLPDDIQVDMDENELAEAIAAAQEILSIASSSTLPSREPSAIHLRQMLSELKFTPMDVEKGTTVTNLPKENSSAVLTSPLPSASTGEANVTPNNSSFCSKHFPIVAQWVIPLIPVKWRGISGKKPPRRTKLRDILISSVLAFTGIVLITIIDYFYLTETFTTQNEHSVHVRLLSGAYAATAVLVYEAYQSPLAQPRNVIGSFTVASIIGVSVRIFCQTVGKCVVFVIKDLFILYLYLITILSMVFEQEFRNMSPVGWHSRSVWQV